MIYGISTRIIAMVVGGLIILALLIFGVKQCDQRRSAAAQSRVERSQAEAASNSAADAIGTVARSGEASAASEEQSRQSEKDIRVAEGSDQAVNPAVRDAGLQALCKRKTYANSPRCRRP